MLTAMKHVADDEFCVQQDSTLAHRTAHSQTAAERTLNFSSFNNGLQLTGPAVKPTDYEIYEI